MDPGRTNKRSAATVAQAAEAHGVAPRQIAKTLSLRLGDRVVLIVAAGDAIGEARGKARGVFRAVLGTRAEA